VLLLHERDPERNPLDIFDEVAERTGLSFDRVKYLLRARRSPRPLPVIHDFAGRHTFAVCRENGPTLTGSTTTSPPDSLPLVLCLNDLAAVLRRWRRSTVVIE
jgi:hypothetical protein